jgi:SAM-dependent methyltransferase
MSNLALEAVPQFRADYLVTREKLGDRRPVERIRAHYMLERQLAQRLLSSSKSDRGHVYTDVYAELFRMLPDHPQHIGSHLDPSDDIPDRIRLDLKYLQTFLSPDTVFLEIGCGDAEMSYAVANLVRSAYGLDVTDALIEYGRSPGNFRFVKTACTNIDLPDHSVDVAFSNQLMEHLHPDDAESQVREVVRVLRPGGSYLCRTPNRVTGPHDVSRYFDQTATGFHLCEYDYGSVRQLFMRAGFRKVKFLMTSRGRKAPFPYWVAQSVELALRQFPQLKRSRVLAHLMELNVVGVM